MTNTKHPASGGGTGPEAPAGFRVVGRSGKHVPQMVGQWIRHARWMDGTPNVASQPRQIPCVGLLLTAQDKYNNGQYDLLEPVGTSEAHGGRTGRQLDR